ncbi:2OG-Fe(II) oxygenase family protein [Vibrio sp. Vb339]|uniref:2OG-Fe(II) oxygenase family protein n=1 Tax=Vibrio sp. Vb339 TaxID=1192013 RepID=UPI0015534645|nr:2OG-Fe(II) oxygenase family protein [Vibrio sp. Vb339]
MSNVYSIFPTTIYHNNLAVSAVEKEAKNYILDQMKDCNVSTAFTTYNDNDQLQLLLPFKDLVPKLVECLSEYTKLIGYKNISNLKITSMWGSVQLLGGYHGKHIHANSHVSGTYYIDIPDNSAPITFYDPKESHRMMDSLGDESNPRFARTCTVFPKKGDIVLFPGWLQHKVEPHTNDVPRVTISFNATICN